MKEITPYKDSQGSKKEQVTQMFDKISGNYDVLNRVISMGLDVSWRNNVLKMVAERNPISILDIATGTGDMPILFSKSSAEEIVGLDISAGMLKVAQQKIEEQNLEDRVRFELGDAEALEYDADRFDAITVCYGIRNFEHLRLGLSELLRVLKPGGILVILETSIPARFPIKQGYLVYTNYILPLIGRLFSKDKKAYAYLSKSAMHFPYGEALKEILQGVGYISVEVIPQSMGISTIYRAFKKS